MANVNVGFEQRTTTETAVAHPKETGSVFHSLLGVTRITLGLIFLWAFLDKLLGLGFATKAEGAWINGGSPTMGFLKFGTAGPFAGFYQSLAGNAFVDALFMSGLLLVGLALTLGVGVRIAGYSGALMMMLMWTAHLPPENNPVLDDHIVNALVLLALAAGGAGRWLGLGRRWASTRLVKEHPILE